MNMQTPLTTASPDSAAIDWDGGLGELKADGTWGSGTLTLKWCETPAGTYVPIGSGVSLSADGLTGFRVPAGHLKAFLTGSAEATVNFGVAPCSGKSISRGSS